MKDSVVVIIDMQNDYCDTKGFYSKRDGSDFEMNCVADKIVRFYEDMIEKNCKIVCFSIVYPEGDNPCVENTWGSEYYKIKPQKHFFKTDFSCFTNSDFCDWLVQNKIKKIYLCGFQMTFCVKATYCDAKKRGYEVFLIEDLIGERKKHEEKAKSFLKNDCGCDTIISSSMLYDII